MLEKICTSCIFDKMQCLCRFPWLLKLLQQLYKMGFRLISHEVNAAVMFKPHFFSCKTFSNYIVFQNKFNANAAVMFKTYFFIITLLIGGKGGRWILFFLRNCSHEGQRVELPWRKGFILNFSDSMVSVVMIWQWLKSPKKSDTPSHQVYLTKREGR